MFKDSLNSSEDPDAAHFDNRAEPGAPPNQCRPWQVWLFWRPELAGRLWPATGKTRDYAANIQEFIRIMQRRGQPRSLDAVGILESGQNLSMGKTSMADEQASMKPRLGSMYGCPFGQEVEFARSGLNLFGQAFFWKTMENADITGSVFRHVNMSGSTFEGVNLSGALFFNANLRGATVGAVDFGGASFSSFAELMPPGGDPAAIVLHRAAAGDTV